MSWLRHLTLDEAMLGIRAVNKTRTSGGGLQN